MKAVSIRDVTDTAKIRFHCIQILRTISIQIRIQIRLSCTIKDR